ncbi:MATE family efflux transporter [bacterium]|nr:MATE family efflux transporter [bacterium]
MLNLYKNYIKELLQIAFPIILGNVGFIMIGVGDVIVAGRHSTDTLAAVSLATAIINCITIMGIGVLGSISPILSNYRGANKQPEKYFYPSLKFALAISVIISFAILVTMPFIDKLGFEAHLVPLIKDYFFVTAFSTFGAYLHYMSKEFLQAFEIVMFPNLLTIFCIFLNLFLNIIFAFGYGLIPEMGVKGLAIASLIVRYFMGLVLFFYCYKKIDIKYHKDKEYYKEMLKVGLPSSLAIMIEFVAFNSITVIMGRVSGLYAAAQNIICTITSISFMVPLAIGNAAGVKVGFANGAKLYKDLKNYAYTALILSAGFMAASAIIIAIAPGIITNLFTTDLELIKICVPIIYTLCFFQVFDGIQAALAGIFRGLKHTEVIMLANFIAFWVIALPLGCLLALHFKLNLMGFWYALIVSIIILCIIVFVNLLQRFKKMTE